MNRARRVFDLAGAVEEAPGMVREAVNTWLHLGDVRPEYWWDSESDRFDLRMSWSMREVGGWGQHDRPGLFGCLSVQLALRIAAEVRMATCSFCGTDYPVERSPRRGKRNFCPSCRDERVPQRLAQRDYEARQRAQRD